MFMDLGLLLGYIGGPGDLEMGLSNLQRRVHTSGAPQREAQARGLARRSSVDRSRWVAVAAAALRGYNRAQP
jgi:hypothetical protein